MLGEGFRLIVLNYGREPPLQAVILDASNKAAENFGAWLISPHKGVKALGAGLTSDTRLNCSAASTMGAARTTLVGSCQSAWAAGVLRLYSSPRPVPPVSPFRKWDYKQTSPISANCSDFRSGQ
jgi:hypothetical protein